MERKCDGVAMLAVGEAAMGRKKGGDDASWVDANLTSQKIKKIHMVDSPVTNGRLRFKVMMN
jgi:hypothetical protein